MAKVFGDTLGGDSGCPLPFPCPTVPIHPLITPPPGSPLGTCLELGAAFLFFFDRKLGWAPQRTQPGHLAAGPDAELG